jgi:hypothetical protein
MAVGDLFWFDHANEIGFPASSAFSSGDAIHLGLNTTAGVTNTTTQGWDAYTEATTGDAGGYPSSGTDLGDWGAMWSYAGKVATFDSAVNPTYTQSTKHSTNVTFAIGYNLTEVGARTLFAVDLGGVNMRAGDLTINNQSLH